MIFSGKTLQVSLLDSGIAEMCFDRQEGSVNVFDELALSEAKEAVAAIAANSQVTAVMISSNKQVFIAGADINEFNTSFAREEDEIAKWLIEINTTIFDAFEDLQVPTVAALNGAALGGGFEMALAADYRVMSKKAIVGFPETSLGIIPGWGGTVRLPRLIGAENAIEWIAGGKNQKADTALANGAVDAVVEHDKVREAALSLLQQCLDGKLNYLSKRQEKLEPLKFNEIEATMAFSSAKAMLFAKVGPNYPAPMVALETIEKAAGFGREGAIKLEAKANAMLARTLVAKNLVGLFQGDQQLGKTANEWSKTVKPVTKSAVLGAGIMGGGIAYQTALKGTPIVMKDIAQAGIDLGLSEATKLLSKGVKRGRMTPEKMAEVLNRIQPTLSYDGFDQVDVAVEAVVENPNVKKVVLAETEKHLRDDAILASNTSTISITELATALDAPENFCGMHFFNPVHQMPLVEIIRGEKTSDETVAKVVNYALAMGKKAVVVNDCPGFLVNRILFPYLNSFIDLVKRGVDFARIDKVMEKFGWPMGPAYLSDVIGLDTILHGGETFAEGFPDRAKVDYESAWDVLFKAERLGQKSGKGFYAYEPDKRGRIKKVIDSDVATLLAPVVDAPLEISDEQIIEQLMLSMGLEAVRCLQDNIAANAVDVDMSLIYGVGFPAFRGGILRYLDTIGISAVVQKSEQYSALGGRFVVPEMLLKMADNGESFYA